MDQDWTLATLEMQGWIRRFGRVGVEPKCWIRNTTTKGDKIMAPRAFISFEMEDKWARDFLKQHSKDDRNDVEFVDYSVQKPFDSAWKTECKKRIARTKGTVVMIGPTTHKSAAVLWEIDETIRQGHFMFGIQINKDKTHTVPAGLPAKNVIRWNFDQISKWLATWT